MEFAYFLFNIICCNNEILLAYYSLVLFNIKRIKHTHRYIDYNVFNCSVSFLMRCSSISRLHFFVLFRKMNSIPIRKWYHHRCNGINVYNVIKFIVRLVVAHCSILVFGFCKAIAIAKWHHNNNNWNNPLFYYGDLCDANKTDKTNFIAKIVYWNLYTLMELETSRSEGERAKWHEKNRTKLLTQSVGWLLLLLLFFLL